jgi:predicted Rossmann fold nucleotide-binding protein DprA/Smf involved in DNA uptake
MPVAKRPTARIAAGFARDLGREVFAVPGRIDAPASVGSNELIVEGARPRVRLAEAVLERGSRERATTPHSPALAEWPSMSRRIGDTNRAGRFPLKRIDWPL